MPDRDDDVLNVFNSNTQNNNFNQGKTEDDVLNVLNENTQNLNPQPTNKYGFSLTESESAARQAADLDVAMNVPHVDDEEINYLKQQERRNSFSVEEESDTDRSTSVLGGYRTNADGSVNTTKSLASDLVAQEQSISIGELYKDTLGRTAYEDLKSACGLQVNESFTDFYNRTHYIPRGWEIEARMCLIEEKRMKLYSEYQAGNISESDFLYQAYGKDLMKESGYDMDSKLFWYKRIKNGDYTSPLDSDTFLTDLLANAKSMFQAETWYRDSTSKQLSETLAGLVTGNRLSSEKFYEVFKNQVDALKPYFDEDVNKIITYYKAGTLGSAFSPFVDIDGDNKYDYYYHTDGRLYAVKDSSGVGKSQCTITYNDDGSVHAVQVNDGFDGPIDSLLEGFRDFWVGMLDIVQMIDSAAGISAIVHAVKGDKYFMDAHQNWEAFKKSTWALGDEDYVTFDDVKKYNGTDWANAICKGVGQVAGMIVLAIATWGIGAAASGAGTAVKEGTQIGTDIAKDLLKEGAQKVTSESVKSAMQQVAQKVAEKLGESASKAAIQRATQQAIATVGKELSKEMGKAAFQEIAKGIVTTTLKTGMTVAGQQVAGTTMAKLTAKNIGTGVAKAANVILQAGTKGRSGFVVTTKGIAGTVWGQSMQIAATNAVKDFIQVGTQLEAKNPGLQYLESATGGQVKALSTGDIWTRALATAGADFVISSLFRAQGDIGVSTRFNAIFQHNKMLTDSARTLLADPNITQSVKNSALNMVKHMGAAMWTDNAFDIIENITTAGAQAAFANPYAKLGSAESWQTFWQSAYNPQSLIMNAYIGMKNTISFGTSANMVDSRLSTFAREANLSANRLGNTIKTYISALEQSSGDPKRKDAAIAALEKMHANIMDRLNDTNVKESSKISASAKSLNNIMEVASDMDKVFSIDDETAIKSFGLSKDEAQEIRQTIQMLNANRPNDVPEYGMATAILFNQASKTYAENIREVYKEIIQGAADHATNRNKIWKSLADFSGKLPFGDYIKAKQAQSTFEEFVNSVAARSSIDISNIRHIDLRDLIVSNRFKTLSFDSGTSYAKFKQAIDTGLIKTYVFSDATALSEYAFDIEETDNGYTVKAVYDKNRQETSKPAEGNPFLELLYDKENNKEAVEQLIKMGIITSLGKDGERESLYHIVSTGTPWFGFTIDESMRNEILKAPAQGETNPLRDIVIAMDTIADLCNPELSADTDGYAGIDWTLPIMTRVSFKRRNGSGGITDSSLYIIPNQSSSTQLDIVNRLQVAQALIYNYYKILTLSKSKANLSSSQQNELQNAIACMSYLMDEHLVMNDYEDFNKVLSDPAKRKEYLDERLPLVAKTILFKADMSKDETTEGFGRNQIIKLYKDGILNEDILKDFADVSEKDTQVGAVAREVLKYTELVRSTKTVLGIVDKMNSNGTLTNADLNEMKKYVGIMKDPNNASVRSYLEKDNQLTNFLQKIIDDPTKYIPFFNGLVGNGRHLSLEECSTILEKRNINDPEFQEFVSELIGNRYKDFYEMSNTYVKSAKKALTRIFYGDDFKFENRSNIFKNMNASQIVEFLSDPYTAINKVPTSKAVYLFDINDKENKLAFSSDMTNFTKGILGKAGLLNKDGTVDTNALFIKVFNFENESELDPLHIKLALLKGETEQAKFYRNLILIANKDYIGDVPRRIVGDDGIEKDFIRVKNGQLVIGKDDELLGDYILNNTDVKQLISENKKDLIIDRIKNDIELYDQYIGEGSELTEAKNVVEVNLLELLPKNLKSATLKFIESINAKVGRGATAKMINDEIKSEMEALFTGTYSTSTTEQYVAYKKMVISKILNGNFLMQYDINSNSSMNKFKTLMAALGYGKDYSKVLSGALQVDGVSVKNKPVHVIKTEITAQKMFSALMKLSPISFINTIKDGKDYKFVLANLFSGNQYVDDNTVFDLKDIKFTNGVSLDGNIEDWKLTEGLEAEYFDRAIKAALQGGNFADFFTVLNKRSSFEGTVNQLSADTNKALKVINRVFEYLYGDKTEYAFKVLRIQARSDSKRYAEIMDMYSKPNSLWKATYNAKARCIELTPKEKPKNTSVDMLVDNFIKTHIESNNNEFNFKELFPVWDSDTSLKSTDLEMNKDISYETLFSIISELGFDDLKTPKDFIDYGDKPIKLFSLNDEDYDALVTKLSGKTIKEIETILEDNSDLISKNYYANMLAFYFKTVRASSKILTDSLNTPDTTPLIQLCNKNILDNLGELLNTTYKNIFEGGLDTKDIKNLTDSLSEATGKQISIESVTALLRILDSAEENQLVTLSNNTGLAKRNPTLNAFAFLEIGDEGKLSLSLEDYIKASKQDRKVFLWNLEQLAKLSDQFDAEEISAIKKLITDLETKDDLITQLNADRELTVEDQTLKNVIKGETTSPNEPSIQINPEEYFVSSGKAFNKTLVAELVANNQFLRKGQDKFITLSSTTESGHLVNDTLSMFMKDVLGRTLDLTTDKLGSALIYNMQSDEAVAEFFLSSYTWAQYIKQSLFVNENGEFVNKFKGMNEKQVNKMLYDLAMKANLYSTGTTFAAEYAGALMLEYDPSTKTYEIKPMITSVSNPDDDILTELMLGKNNINQKTDKVQLMIKVNQNTFIDNISGYNSGFETFDLSDDRVRQSVYSAAYFNAKQHKGAWYINNERRVNYQDIIKEYYIDNYKLKAYDMRKNFYDTCIEYGLSDEVIKTTLQSVENLSTSQPTSWAEQAIETLKRQVGITNEPFVENYQFKALHDALLYAINKDSLSDETIVGFTNYVSKLESDNSESGFKYTSDVDTVIENLRSGDSSRAEQGYKLFSSLSVEEQKSVLLHTLLDESEIDGLTLTLVSNARNGKTLYDVCQKLLYDYDQKNIGNDVSSEIYIKPLKQILDGFKQFFPFEEDFDNLLKSISFDGIDISKDQKLFDDINLYSEGSLRFARNNKFLDKVISAFQLMETAKSLRADSKELENRIKDVLMGNSYTGLSRQHYISSVKKQSVRNDIRNIFLNLLSANGIDLANIKINLDPRNPEDTLKDKALSDALSKTFNAFSKAAYKYVEDLKQAHKYNQEIQSMSMADKIEEFASSGKDNMIKYLSESFNGVEAKQFSLAELQMFDSDAGRKYVDAFLENFDFRMAEENSNIKKFVDSVMSPLYEHMTESDEKYFKDINPQFLLSNLVRVSGYTTEGAELYAKKLQQIRNYGNIIEITSKSNKELHDFIINDLLQSELFQKRALWTMTHENSEFDGSIGYGCVKVNPKILRDAFGYTDSKEFYTLMWRQPGQQRTVMHNVKVIPDENVSGIAFSRRTARDYFNGDFDGDSYFFAQPGKDSQYFGEQTFDYLNYGGSLYDKLFDGVNINYDSADKYKDIETKVRPFFETEEAQNLIKGLYSGTTTVDEFNGYFSDWIQEKTDLDPDDMIKAFGFKEIKTMMQGYQKMITSNNYLLGQIGDAYRDVVQLIDDNNQMFLRAAFLLSDDDATWLGQSSKGQMRNFKVKENKIKKVSDALYETSIGMSKDSNAQLIQIFKALSNNPEAIQKVKNNIYNYIDQGVQYGFVSKKHAETLKRDIANSATLDQDQVLIIAQILQVNKVNSKSYDDVISKAIKAPETSVERTKLNQKLNGVIDIMEKIGGYNGKVLADMKSQLRTNPYGPQSLRIGSQLVDMLLDRRLTRNPLFMATSDNVGVTKLLRDFATKCDVDIISKDNISYIGHKGFSSINKNVVGLSGKVVVAIQTDGEYTDSIGVYDRTKNGGKNLTVNQSASYRLNDMSSRQKTKLVAFLNNLRGDVDNSELATILRESGFNIKGKQRILAFVDRLGNVKSLKSIKVEDIKDGAQLIFNNDSSLIDHVNNHVVKFGAASTKDFKGTGYATNIVFGKEVSGDEVPQFIVDQKIASIEKLSPLTGYRNLGKTIQGKDSKGNTKTFALVEVDNMALLNVLDMEDMSYGIRNMDVVSLLSGSQGIDASFNLGSLFITVNSDGKVVYDPSGYWNLMSTIGKYTKPVLQDVNGCNLVRYNRIAILLNQLEEDNPEEYQIAIKKIADSVGSDAITAKDVLTALEKCGDLGGYTGESIESYIYSRMSVDKKRDFGRMLQDKANVFARVFFSDEVQDALKSRIQTSAEYDPNYVAQKKEDIAHSNPRIASASNYSEGINYERMMEGSAEDLNTAFISRRSILNLLLTELNKQSDKGIDMGLNNSLINDMIRNGQIDPEDIWSGNIADGYRPILKYQGLELNPEDYPERTQSKKDGRFYKMDMATRNEEAENLIGYVKKSLLADNGHEYSKTMIDQMDAIRGLKGDAAKRPFFTYVPATRIMPFLTRGTDEDIYDGLTGYKNKFFVEQMSKKLSTANDELSLTPEWSTPDDMQQQGASLKSQLMSASKASEYLSHIQNKEDAKTYAVLLEKKQKLFKHELHKLNLVERLHLLEDRRTLYETDEAAKAFKELLKNEKLTENGSLEAYENYRTIEQGTFADACWDSLSQANLITAVQLTSSKNGYEFYNSAMRSWGFKSDNNVDIALGTKVLRLNNVSDNEAKSLLGNEYIQLVNASKYCKDLSMQLEEYLQARKLLELYESFVSNENAFRKAMPKSGPESYDACMDRLLDTLKAQGGLETLRTYLDNMYKNNVELSILIDSATKINERIIEAAKQISPYEYVSWFVRMDDKEENNKWFGFEKVNAFDLSHQKFDDVLLGSMSKANKGKIASIFSGTDDGYLASVTVAATRLAKKKAMKSFAKYMMDNGYMDNLRLYSVGIDSVNKTLESFIKSYKEDFASGKISEEQYQYDKATYNQLRYIAIELGLSPDVFTDYNSFSELYDYLMVVANQQREALHYTSFESMVEARNSMQGFGNDNADREKLNSAINTFNAAQNTLSTMIAMMVERGHFQSANEFLTGVYDLAKSKLGEDYVIVDKYGAKLEEADTYVPSFLTEFDMDDAIREIKYGKGLSGERKKAAIAQMILCGDAFAMKKSLADQLENKVFTKLKHSKFYNLMNKCKNIATSLIMSSPTQLLDRILNFPIFDIGVDAGADFRTLNEVPTAKATVNKFVAMFDSLTQDQIDNDKDLQYLVRFLYASNNELKNATSYRGEKLATGSLPALKQYLKMTNQLYTIGNVIPRFAYYLNMVKNAEANNYEIDPIRIGVAYHMKDGIKQITNDVDEDVYKNVDEAHRQQAANIDAQAIQVIAEHNGIEGNMPYAATWLNQRFNTMFVTFPMALLRWADNRVRSLGYAISQCTKGAEGWTYLGDQVLSNAMTGALLLMLQLALSTNTREWLKKKASNKDDEITEEEQEAAQNILFRGGQVKLFGSLLSGEEITTAKHSRDPASALFDSYIADFIPQFNGGEKNFGTNLMNKIKEKTLGHTPFVLKDAIESIPGNTWLQSSTYYSPGDNYLENYGRKVLGYTLGTAQANALVDYYKTADDTTDDNFLRKLGDGMEYAFTRKFANTKEAKAEHRNYKKAFSLVYEYKNMVETNADSPALTSDNKYFSDLKSDLQNAMIYMNDSSALYSVISEYTQKGVSLATIKSALKSLSLKQQIMNLDNYHTFMQTLSPQEKSVIKSAIAYEDYNYPFLDDVYNDIATQYQKEKAKKGNNRYVASVGSLLKTMNYNTPKDYSYNTNTRRYNNYSNYTNFINRYLNNVQYQNKYKQGVGSPMQAYNQSLANANSGVSTDVWGNQTRHYTDGTEYSVRQQGMPILGGNK